MKVKTAIVSMIVLLTIFSTVPVSAKRVSVCPPTSLEVWKTITCVTRVGDQVTVRGTIYVQNDVTNPAKIGRIKDVIQAKGNGPGWIKMNEVTVATSIELDPGETDSFEYVITFDAGDFKAYRNMVRVNLLNHPTGNRWFKYRISFNIP